MSGESLPSQAPQKFLIKRDLFMQLSAQSKGKYATRAISIALCGILSCMPLRANLRTTPDHHANQACRGDLSRESIA
jgi:hypothetical protein